MRELIKTGRDDSDGIEATPLGMMMGALRPVFRRILVFSALINLLTLSVSLYLMQVYDRVLTSQSKDTLYFLTLAVFLAILLSAFLEGVRLFVASRCGTWLATTLGPSLLMRSLEQRLTTSVLRLEAIRELGALKNFMSTSSVFNIVDMVWIPFYMLVVFFLHPLLGTLALVGAGILFALAWLNDVLTRPIFSAAQSLSNSNVQRGEGLVRNSEVIDAMGMAQDAVSEWSQGYIREMAGMNKGQEKAALILAASKFVRYMLQVLLLCIGCLLVLDLQATPGTMIAASILVGRLLAPIESSISQWRQFVLARHSYKRLKQFYSLPLPRTSTVSLPDPIGAITVAGLTYVPPGLPTPILRNVNFELEPGESLAIIGPSASGKTTLARLIMGILKPSAGSVRLDSAETFEWKRHEFGKHVGYLPQDIELFPGTIFSNIARFQNASSEKVVDAAQLAGCHDLILHLPGGYEMGIGEGAHRLSGGQRQRIGLARALLGRPRLVVLDEPNSNLDNTGENALIDTMRRLKEIGSTVIVVAHRTTLLRSVDKILVLQNGRVTNFGPAGKVLQDLNVLTNPNPQAEKPAQQMPGGPTTIERPSKRSIGVQEAAE
jgi:ATP-binding cassette subfamily C protein/ATP-binding cassette subfamily C exporter for protease/lipase